MVILSLMTRRPPRSTPFPTRRSSDLRRNQATDDSHWGQDHQHKRNRCEGSGLSLDLGHAGVGTWNPSRLRSEEHTSELQSQSNLVCRLLLEKKKNPETF